MWAGLLESTAKRLIRIGDLKITWPNGQTRAYGDGTGPSCAITLHGNAILRRLVLDPELALGEGYMNGALEIEGDDIRTMLAILASNARAAGRGRFNAALPAARKALRRLTQNNTLAASRHNVEVHYDLSVRLYELFLDEDLQYTCGYFPHPDMTIEEAQVAKKAHIAKKLLIEPGMKVMDIGCGWGGLSITLARDYGARVVGVSLSKVQLEHAAKRAEAMGVSDLIEWRLVDYRNVREEFDRIVVVGMMEHVGQPQYATFFDRMHRNLSPDGVALVHTIGRATPPGLAAPFINKYIFPGAYVPAMSEVLTEIERNKLIVTDIEVWRTHYVDTLRAWQDRFEQNRAEIEAMYDARFIRMWRYYLIASEIGFTHLENVIFHFQLARRQLAVPRTRDYMTSALD